MKYYMGIDIGTYESKGVLVDDNARVIAEAAVAHIMETPKPGYAEHDAENTWWGDLRALSNALISKSGAAPKQIQALGLSAIAPCCLPVDENLNPLRKAILYGVDVRAHREIADIEAALGKREILSMCGSHVTSQSAAAKIMWIERNEPEIYARAHKFITSTTYLVGKLTGNIVIDHYTAAAWVPLYDVNKLNWADDLHGIVSRDKLADCVWTSEVAGRVHARAARETGLCEGTIVLAGTADAAADAFGAGAHDPGDLLLMYGSSLFFIHVTDRMHLSDALCTSPFLYPGTYAVTAGMNCAGTLTRWFRDKLAPDIAQAADSEGENPYARLARMAAESPRGSNGLIVLPYFSGERTPINDPLAKGVVFGLNLNHTRADIFRACLEGVGCAVKQHFDIFKSLGLSTERVFAVGGGTKNDAWLSIVSDICGREQCVASARACAAYGDALMAALATGRYGGRSEIKRILKAERVVRPDMDAHEFYKPLTSKYARLYEATKDIMHE